MHKMYLVCFFFFSSRRRHTRLQGDWSSDVCSSDLIQTIHRGRRQFTHDNIVALQISKKQKAQRPLALLVAQAIGCRANTTKQTVKECTSSENSEQNFGYRLRRFTLHPQEHPCARHHHSQGRTSPHPV